MLEQHTNHFHGFLRDEKMGTWRKRKALFNMFLNYFTYLSMTFVII